MNPAHPVTNTLRTRLFYTTKCRVPNGRRQSFAKCQHLRITGDHDPRYCERR